jgi:hypothetical protein
MSNNLLPYQIASASSPFPNETFTVVTNESGSQSLLNSSNVNVSNDLNVEQSFNGLMPIKTMIGYTPTEFCSNSGGGSQSDKNCWFLMTRPGKSEKEVDFRLPMPEKTFFFQGVVSNYDQRTTTELLCDDNTVAGNSISSAQPEKNPYDFPTCGFDIGYGPVEDGEPCCQDWPSTSQSLFRCVSATSVNSIAAVTSTNSDGMNASSTGVLNTQNAALSTPGTVGAPADQFCTIAICSTGSWTLETQGLVVCLSYWEIPLVPCDTKQITTPGVESTATPASGREKPSRNTAARALWASTL